MLYTKVANNVDVNKTTISGTHTKKANNIYFKNGNKTLHHGRMPL